MHDDGRLVWELAEEKDRSESFKKTSLIFLMTPLHPKLGVQSKENKWNAPEGTSEGFGEDGDVPGGTDPGGMGLHQTELQASLSRCQATAPGRSLARAQSLSGWSCTLFSSTVTAYKAVAQLRGVVSHIRATNFQGCG